MTGAESEACPVLLVGISNPETIPQLMGLSACIAHGAGHGVVATHIVTVPEQMQLSAARSSPEVGVGTQLLRRAIAAGNERGLAARGVVEVARDVHEGLLSAADNQGATLVLVGYSEFDEHGTKAERAFDRLMYRVARGIHADLIVAKFRRTEVGRVMVPLLGGLNLPVSGPLVRALKQEHGSEVTFVRAVSTDADVSQQQADLHSILESFDLAGIGDELIVPATDPTAALIEQANEYDLAIIGAERPTLTDAIFGNMAEKIASQATCSAYLVRATRRD